MADISLTDEALLQIAKAHYPIGTQYWPAHLGPRTEDEPFNTIESSKFSVSDGVVWNGQCGSRGEYWNAIIYVSGKWADTLAEMDTKPIFLTHN